MEKSQAKDPDRIDHIAGPGLDHLRRRVSGEHVRVVDADAGLG